jgi:hypothetical protein
MMGLYTIFDEKERTMRTWRMYSREEHRPETGEVYYIRFSPIRDRMRYYSVAPEDIRVLDLIEDENGDYKGWLPSGDDMLSFIQHERIFGIGLSGAPAAMEAEGKGKTVTVRIVDVTDEIDETD